MGTVTSLEQEYPKMQQLMNGGITTLSETLDAYAEFLDRLDNVESSTAFLYLLDKKKEIRIWKETLSKYENCSQEDLVLKNQLQNHLIKLESDLRAARAHFSIVRENGCNIERSEKYILEIEKELQAVKTENEALKAEIRVLKGEPIIDPVQSIVTVVQLQEKATPPTENLPVPNQQHTDTTEKKVEYSDL